MIDRYLPLLQEHNPDLAAVLPEWIDTINQSSTDSEDWSTQVGKSVIAITGRLSEYDSYESVGAAFIYYVSKK